MEIRKIIDTKHPIERFADRYSDISEKDIESIIYKGIDKIIKDHKDRTATYVVWSKSTWISAVIDWREEKYRSDGLNHAVIVTMLPLKRNITTKEQDIKVVVEKYLLSLVPKLKIIESHKHYTWQDINGLRVFLDEGKIYDYGIDAYIEVE